MATSRSREAHLKEKSSSASSSAPHHTDTPHGRRAARPSVPGSPSRDLARKPVPSSSTTGAPRGRSQTPSGTAVGKCALAKSPMEGPSSPSGPPRRAPAPNAGAVLKSSSSLPRTAVSSRPASDKASKPLRSTKAQPLGRSKSLGAATRKPGAATPSTTEPPPATKSAQEGEGETPIQVEESEPVDIPAINDDAPDELELTDSSEPNVAEDTTGSTSQTDQQEPSSPKRELEIATDDGGVGGDGSRVDGDKESPGEPEEKPVMECSDEPKSEPDGGKPDEAEMEEAARVESSETKRPEVAAFKRPEAAATGRKFVKDGPKSNDVIEEARTKLMEKRKSKVLALVGAFETVISLQEPEGQTGQTGQTQGKSEEEEGAQEADNATKESTEST